MSCKRNFTQAFDKDDVSIIESIEPVIYNMYIFHYLQAVPESNIGSLYLFFTHFSKDVKNLTFSNH